MKLVTHRISVDKIDHVATGQAARNGRKAEGFSLRAVAKKMGFTAPYVSDLELGRRTWSQQLILKYLGALQALHNEVLIPKLQKASRNARKSNLFIGGRK